jgi:hypothetical protein
MNDLPMLSLVGRPVAVNPDPDLKRFAREHDWEIRDFRVARKAARVGVPAAASVGAVTGGVVAGLALRRRHQNHGHLRQLWDAVADASSRTGRSVGRSVTRSVVPARSSSSWTEQLGHMAFRLPR